MRLSEILAVGLIATIGSLAPAGEPPRYRVGVAKIDITPDYPIRLAGFGSRRTESEGITHRIFAKALAIDDGEPLLLITVDSCGVPASFTEDLAKCLQKLGVKRERFALTVTHSHTTPMVAGYLKTLFGVPIPPEHQKTIDRYSSELLDKIERVAKDALADRKPRTLSWGVGKVGFAVNRRDKGGPTDHDLPILVVRDLDGVPRAIWVSYACHCVTLYNNKLSGDWAGFAQDAIESDFPGAIALVSIGCGADQNPNARVPGDTAEIATAQGRELAAEVKRVAGQFLAPVQGPIVAKVRKIDLPLSPVPSRTTWEQRAKIADPKQYATAYHAKVQLGKLDRGESLPTKVDYMIQAWTFGDGLAVVFLAGEVVVDFGTRLKRELDARRVWINAYSNDVPCYIPSERILKEGRYEGGGAMIYYDLPGPFAPGLEQPIIDAVHSVVGDKFRSPIDPKKTNGMLPLSPQQSAAALQIPATARQKYRIELMAAEPLVASPVAMAFGPDGKLWVAEMFDYPSGIQPGADGGSHQSGNQIGGRIRVLSASKDDFHYDRSTVFLDKIPFPTGVTAWRNGVLICAAPDILYAEDTDGDGKADVVKKLYSGFGTENFQARVNSLEYGMDGWVYGSCGLFGGMITSFNGKKLALGNRDFRIKPDTGEIEPATGRTQQGRVRDDWDNWFGCDNTHLMWHYPLPDHYIRRNPHVAPPPSAVNISTGLDPTRLFPAGQLQLFQQSGPPGRPTAACGLGVYRDDLLGASMTGDLLVCESVNLLVHRRKLVSRGSTFSANRAPAETECEFLASTDPWFRPVQVRTGPDGCLWVVDMHRYVIEHPRWIPPQDLAKLDLRAGATLGRIFRVRPTDHEPRPLVRLDNLDNAGLVSALDSPNGCQRDLAMQLILWRDAKDAAPALAKLAAESERPEVRLQALCTLSGLDELNINQVRIALHDRQPEVRRHAIRLAERFANSDPALIKSIIALQNDPSGLVRQQLAFSLGAFADADAGRAIVALSGDKRSDAYLRAAAYSSINAANAPALLEGLLSREPDRFNPELLTALCTMVAESASRADLSRVMHTIATSPPCRASYLALAGILDALERRGQSIAEISAAGTLDELRDRFAAARTVAASRDASLEQRTACLALLGRDPIDQNTLVDLLKSQQPQAIQLAAADAIARRSKDKLSVLASGWSGYSPVLQSHVIDLLLSRHDGLVVLLNAIERREIGASQIDSTRRQRLLSSKDNAIRERAVRVFAAAINPDRQKVLDGLQDVLKLDGDVVRGKAIFAKSCANCHRLENVGHQVGPDLAQVQNKTPAYLLQEILDPNRNVDSRYVEYRATTKSGQSVAGLLADESATSITLRSAEQRDRVILRNELDELESTNRSLMPEAFEKDLSRQDLADVLQYLTRGLARN